MQVPSSLGKPAEPVKSVPVRKTTSTSEALVASVSTAMKPKSSEGTSLALKEIELIVLPGEEENPEEGEEKAEEEGSPKQAAVVEIRNALPFRRHMPSVAATVDWIYDRVFFPTAGERATLTQVVAGKVLSNIRRNERVAEKESHRRQDEKKKRVSEDIKEDAKTHDLSQEAIRTDQERVSI